MKKKEAAKDEDGLIETDGWEEEQHSKKLFDRNTVFLIIIFSLTFFILGNATGFFLLDRANNSMYTDPDFFITSSDTVSNPQTKEYNDVSGGQQTALSEAETADSAISDVLSEDAKASDNDGSGNAQENAAKSGSNENFAKSGQNGSNAGGGKASENQSNGSMVYVTPSGKKYHLLASCGGDNAYETTLEEAVSEGKTPCKKCAQ